jgi:hypothetical protein
MTPLAWLAVPVVVTVLAALLLPRWRARRDGLSPQERAAVVSAALADREPRNAPAPDVDGRG